MPGQHDTNKHQISVKFTHQVWRQIEKTADAEGKKAGDVIREAVVLKVGSVELTAEDAEIIARRIREAEEKGGMV